MSPVGTPLIPLFLHGRLAAWPRRGARPSNWLPRSPCLSHSLTCCSTSSAQSYSGRSSGSRSRWQEDWRDWPAGGEYLRPSTCILTLFFQIPTLVILAVNLV